MPDLGDDFVDDPIKGCTDFYKLSTANSHIMVCLILPLKRAVLEKNLKLRLSRGPLEIDLNFF